VPVYVPHPAPGIPSWLPAEPSPADHQARRFTVAWPVPAGTIRHYELQTLITDAGGNSSWENVAGNLTTASYQFTDRVYGQTYRYRVRACSEPSDLYPDSCSGWSPSLDVRLRFPTPDVPGGLAVNNLNKSAGSYKLTWNRLLSWAPAYRYELQENPNDNGWQPLAATVDPVTEHPVSGQTRGVYDYQLRACNPAPDNDCGAWSSSLEVDLFEVVNLGYQYDALGRLVRVIKNEETRTGYCYDAAGNRYQIDAGSGGGEDCPAEPQPPGLPAPTGLSVVWQTGPSWGISWNPVDGAAYYRLRLSDNTVKTVNGTSYSSNSPDPNQNPPAPVWVQACTQNGACGNQAYF
jgi:YD repeat-containing protein